jgi:osmotically-inducible protein OsmY
MKSVLLLGLTLAMGGCDRHDPDATAQARDVPADNTKKNERDRSQSVLTPGDQGNNDVDLGITQKIRQGVVKDDSLSITAKNVKIITADGVVTLRGPVTSDGERTTIGALAVGVPGVQRVDNQLEIAAN